MKIFFTALLLFATGFALRSQPLFIQDTLINETFDFDPTPFMLSEPSGNDHDWVNYDGDLSAGLCVEDAPTPSAWYWEGDFGFPDPQQATNFALTSCSFLENPNQKTANWLITPPIAIPDATYWLCWRSLSYYGPGYLDGYKVLASSSSSNLPNSFSHTLFTAAEMIEDSAPTGSLDPADYVFSPGYIHANSYTDTAYYYEDGSQGPPFLHGKLEPHKVSLADFAGDTIYIAFLHDSQDDFILQVDDIIVTNTTPTYTPQNIVYLNVLPNPARDAAYFSFKLKTAEEGRFYLTDNAGKVVKSQTFGSRDEGVFYMEIQDLEAGIYYCTLETAAGRAATKLVKL
jgi:hypothetical protein